MGRFYVPIKRLVGLRKFSGQVLLYDVPPNVRTAASSTARPTALTESDLRLEPVERREERVFLERLDRSSATDGFRWELMEENEGE